MSNNRRKQTANVLRRLKGLPGLSPDQRRRIEGLEAASWPSELAALAKLWPSSPELIEEYLDVMIEVLHDFPECTEEGPTSSGVGPESHEILI